MNNAKVFAREHSYKIPMLDASVIYRLNASGSGLKLYEKVKNSKGNEKYKPNTALFSGTLKYCLETEKLESVYKEAFRVKSFCSVHNDNRYSDAIISVSFDSTYKEYNVFGKVEGYSGEVEFVFDSVKYSVKITGASIYPQGYAAVAKYASALKGVNMVADIGNGTMNVLYMIDGKPQAGKMFTEKFGTYQATLAIREEFMRKTQRELHDSIIDEILISGSADIAPADLKLIKATAKNYVDDIFRRLREHGYDENTMNLYITGGGGCLVKNFYRYNPDRVKIANDICAAAKGYEYLADVQIRNGRL